ncbi:MAG: hypothetical protein ACRDWV_02350, partial [Acidimicrobiales bacterium]
QYTSQAQAAESESTFAAEVSSSYDEYATLNAVTPVFPGVDVSWISFTSLQSANQGPNGDTCDDWSLDYTMDDVGGVWLIASAAGHAGGPANTSCG